jgi:hypothetical protein
LVSFGHCVFCPSSIYGFWLPLWYHLAIVLSVLLPYTNSDYSFGIFWPLCFLSFFDIRILITPLVSFGHCVVCPSSIYGFWLPLWYILAIVLSVLLRYTDSDYPFVIFKLLLNIESLTHTLIHSFHLGIENINFYLCHASWCWQFMILHNLFKLQCLIMSRSTGHDVYNFECLDYVRVAIGKYHYV